MGVGRYIRELVGELVARGVTCVLFYGRKPREVPFRRQKRIEHVVVPDYPEHTPIHRFFWIQVRLGVAVERSRVDLFHATDNFRLPLALSCPSVLTIHDLIPLATRGYPHRTEDHRLFYEYSQAATARRANHIIAISETTKRDIVRYLGIPARKISTIYEGYRFPIPLHPERRYPHLARRYRLPARYLIYLGGIAERKNIDGLIRAFASLPPGEQRTFSLVIVGHMGGPYAALLQKLVRRLRLSEKVIFVGYLTEEDKFVLLSRARSLIYPSLAEGFGIPILEGFAARVPVITSNRSGTKETAGNAALLVDPRSPIRMRGAILRILSDASLRERLVHRGLERLGVFSPTHMGEATLAVYERVLRNE